MAICLLNFEELFPLNIFIIMPIINNVFLVYIKLFEGNWFSLPF